MLFNSLQFLLFFLPVTLLIFHFGPSRHFKIITLLGSSLVFYAYWDVSYLFLLVSSILFNFGVAKFLSRHRSKGLLWFGILANLACLGYYKYWGLFLGTINSITSFDFKIASITLPLAISFFTFQQISLLIDSYHQRTKPANLLNYATYVSFFPQLIAGPIVRFTDLGVQLATATLRPNRESLISGFTILIIGLFKKTAIADYFGGLSRPIFSFIDSGYTPGAGEAWWANATYAVQLYFDFSGYSDIAIGLALLFGLRLPINFLSPYKATSIADFWKTWHITLTAFFTQYLYLPIALRTRIHSLLGHSLLTIFVMSLVGLWHGASWNFLIWGFIHGAYLTVSRLLPKPANRVTSAALKQTLILLGRAKVFALLVLSYPFFRIDQFSRAKETLFSMFGFYPSRSESRFFPSPETPLEVAISPLQVIFFGLALLILWYGPSSSFLAGYNEKSDRPLPPFASDNIRLAIASIVLGILLAISIINIIVGAESEFLYFQF
ncbi:MAG: MBOAT family protein [Verrucomicrobiae bacterium]|nr:MBOAT family protein [Verrucomicrobiae bacterium]